MDANEIVDYTSNLKNMIDAYHDTPHTSLVYLTVNDVFKNKENY